MKAMHFEEPGSPGADDPANDLRGWRRQTRRSLLKDRAQIAPEVHAAWSRWILDALLVSFSSMEAKTVGMYWPMRGEVDPLSLVASFRARGGRVALPVVVQKGEPLEFRAWDPEAAMAHDGCGIPCPAPAPAVLPDVLLVPLVGFDDACFRLGYGGGFYDRTLAVANPRPLTIGIGFEISRLSTIYPQPYDIPLDFIVSEQRVQARFTS